MKTSFIVRTNSPNGPASGGVNPRRLPPCHRSQEHILAQTCLVALLVLLASSPLFAETLSIPELNAKLEHWKSTKQAPPPVIFEIEGRAAPLGPRQLQFKGCDLRFESDSAIPSFTRRNSNVHVTGQVVRHEPTGGLSFKVQKARELPTDLERFLDRLRGIRQQPSAKWYELADWARARGEFYKDHELLARSDETYHEALKLERRESAQRGPRTLFELAAKARRLQLPESMSEELLHEALAREWQQNREQTGPALDDLARKISETLPGVMKLDAKERGRIADPGLAKRYRAAPVETYQAADAATRVQLQKLLYADVLSRALTSRLTPDGANAFDIARMIEQLEQLPEHQALAESIRDQALAARAREVETLSRPELLDIAEKYRLRNQLAQADHLKESWLTLRRRRLDPDDTEGLIRLTEDYRALLSRHDVANRLLIDSWRKHPGTPDIAERLRKAGYLLQDGAWYTSDEFQARPEGRLQQALRAGRIETGMTASQVRRSLGEPQSQARAATSGQVVEVWTYEQAGSTRLHVRLSKNRRQAELTVADVAQGTE